MEGFSSRKFLIGLGTIALSTVLLWVGKIDQGNWVALLQWTIVGYLAANVGDYAVEQIAAKKEASPPAGYVASVTDSTLPK